MSEIAQPSGGESSQPAAKAPPEGYRAMETVTFWPGV